MRSKIMEMAFSDMVESYLKFSDKPLSTDRIRRDLNASWPTIFRHLQLMEKRGVVICSRGKRNAYYWKLARCQKNETPGEIPEEVC